MIIIDFQVKTVLSMYQKHKVSVGSLTGQGVRIITIMTISLFFLWWLLYNDIICINCRWRKSEERQRQGVLTTYFVFRILYFYVYLYLFSRTQIKFVFTSMCISCKQQSFWLENNTEFYWFSQCVSTWYHLWVSYLSIISLFGGRRGGDDHIIDYWS